ncbi:dTDP-4-amino-4,6-dideoxy-D-galactose acyltransferase [Enterobacteriaceae bacterium H18W14]|uniref:dTDP-4-amino-4,6-dideoxy-D-galactose acyltransferase n=1 Tax=Dryocola boscaweniae TaxID=2925397 RepID=UPI0022F05A8F|nr:dTDP-4-amino-4,6-dideoxy-D-galactose acyltransferase [Dryocola boscaweniae]MCT4713806.1 dTDP-4-amino-4,6-dideoxy-D-galactose acyltransferase [Dryocola boscaweniae]
MNSPLRARLDPLEWENQFFGVNSAIVRFAEDAQALTVKRLEAYGRVQAKIPAHRTDLLDALQQFGFQLVEGEVDLVLPVGTENAASTDDAQAADIPVLREMAARVFTQSRFRAPWYQPADSGRFYAQWVENAVLGTFDHQCLLLKNGDEIQGFVSLRQLNEREARIGLLAGRGVGEQLMNAALYWCQQHRLTTLRVATQISNTAALRRYIQSGATVESTAFWLYR